MKEVLDRVGVAAGGIGVSVAGALQIINGVLAAVLAIASIWYVSLGIIERRKRSKLTDKEVVKEE